MANCVIDKVVIQKEISKKKYVLTLSEREARELILIVGGVTGDISNNIYRALDPMFKGRKYSAAHWNYEDIGPAQLRWAAEGDND